jgi:hypothetical protein
MISTFSFTTVLGTPLMRYFLITSGNSAAPTDAIVTLSLAIDIRIARLTARGQCGHVGVTNTWMCTGSWTDASSPRLVSFNPGSSTPPTRRMDSRSEENS